MLPVIHAWEVQAQDNYTKYCLEHVIDNNQERRTHIAVFVFFIGLLSHGNFLSVLLVTWPQGFWGPSSLILWRLSRWSWQLVIMVGDDATLPVSKGGLGWCHCGDGWLVPIIAGEISQYMYIWLTWVLTNQ